MDSARASLADVALLDNAIWHALATEQAYLAQGNELARRFPPDISPFAAMRYTSPEAFQALAEVLDGDFAALAFVTQPNLPAGWVTRLTVEANQMIFEGSIPPEPKQEFRRLTEEDVPAMLALTKLTEPGPFFPRTIELGSYFGIFDADSLVSMAGERMHLSGFTEVSAVCTHPDYSGRGYGSALMSVVMAGILRRGETPFLHVKVGNPAIGLYQRLGFKVRALQHLAVIKYAPA
jgi:ribosomal protein S18 acetylase RimI-like enzyme